MLFPTVEKLLYHNFFVNKTHKAVILPLFVVKNCHFMGNVKPYRFSALNPALEPPL
jgi:hypothetical protein